MKIRILMTLVFAVSLFLLVIGAVNAGCCLIVDGGAPTFCVNSTTEPAGCADGMWLSEDCEERAECAPAGCCVVESECRTGYSPVACTSISGGFEAGDRECERTPSCGSVCCEFSSGGSEGYDFMPGTSCTSLGGDPVPDVVDGIECLDLNPGIEGSLGCCVSGNGSCSYVSEESCEGEPQRGFYCRDFGERCDPVCNSHQSKGPGAFNHTQYDLYWKDSCGNQEDLAEDCDDATEMPMQDEDSIWYCGDATCSAASLWDNPVTDENHDNDLDNDNNFHGRDYRFNGETWCEYMQSKVGPGTDLPGSRHYRHYCVFGKERVEVKGTGRQNICVEKEVDTSYGRIYNATWLTNDPQACLACNAQEDPTGCCNSRIHRDPPVGCAYIQRKDLTNDDSIDLLLDSSDYNELQDVLDGEIEIDWAPDAHADRAYLDYYYLNGTRAKRSENILTNPVIVDTSLRENVCEEGICAVTVNDLPEPGTYDVKVWGHACACVISSICCGCIWERCGEEDHYIGEFTFTPQRGICVPLVPLSSNESCGMFSNPDTNFVLNEESQLDSFLEFNYYFDFPYNGLAQAGDCDNTEECRQNLLGNFSYSISGLLVADNMNSLCRSIGDCGAAPNLANEVSVGGFVVSGVCTTTVSDPEQCAIPAENVSYIQSQRLNALHSGTSVRPEQFLPLLFLIPVNIFSRRFNKKNLILFLLLVVVILSGCATGIYDPLNIPEPTNFSCEPWSPPLGNSNCEKCHTKIGNEGLLPDVELNDTGDLTPAYKCTSELCWSLGQGCIFVEGIEGPRCEENVASEHTVPRVRFTDLNYTCNSIDASGCTADVFNPLNNNIGDSGDPSIFITGKIEPYVPLIIDFSTVATSAGQIGDEIPTQCTYGIDDISAPNPFPYPENAETTETNHVLRIAELAPRGTNYKAYIKCMNVFGEENLVGEGTVEFNIGQSIDFTSPSSFNINPPSPAYIKYGDTTKVVTLYARGNVRQCRWDNESVIFDNMGNVTIVEREILADGTEAVYEETNITTSFSCSRVGAEESLANSCPADLRGIKLGENKFWFACISENGIVSQTWPLSGYTVIGTDQLNITNIQCEHSLGTNCDRIFDSNFNFSINTVGGADGNAQCRWAVDEFDFQEFTEPGGTVLEPNPATFHKQVNYSHSTGTITLRFECEDVAENIAQSNVTISVENDNTLPKITKVYRSSDGLYVHTDELTTCSFITSRIPNFVNATQFSTDDGRIHRADLIGETGFTRNFYKIRCEDRFDNLRDMDVYIGKP